MSDTNYSKQLVGKILRIEGWGLFFGGLFFATKPYYTDFELLGADMDLKFGYALILIGFMNIFIANKFFKRDAK